MSSWQRAYFGYRMRRGKLLSRICRTASQVNRAWTIGPSFPVSAYGPPTTIYNRYNRWSQRRIWQRIFEKMAAAGPVPDELSIDSSHVKAHRSAAGSKGGVRGSDWQFARRKNEQNPCFGR